VLDGRISDVNPDAKGEDATNDFKVTSEADIGSYLAVPLLLSDGRRYGTLCCVSHTPDPWLRQRDLELMEKVARRVVEQLDARGACRRGMASFIFWANVLVTALRDEGAF
jgi:GAF domain-containing protein